MVEPVAIPSSIRITVLPRTFGSEVTAPVGQFAPFQFLLFLRRHRIDHLHRDTQASHDLFIEHADASGGDGAHGQFAMAGRAELPHDENIERRAQRLGHLERHRHAAARQPEHDYVRLIRVTPQFPGQELAGFDSVPKDVSDRSAPVRGV